MLETLVRISPAAIIGLNARGEIDLWSAAAVELFGWTEAEIAGQPLPPGLRVDANPLTASVTAKDRRVVEVERPEGDG